MRYIKLYPLITFTSMRLCYYSCGVLLLVLNCPAFSQDTFYQDFHSDTSLYQRFLANPGNEDAKLKELKTLADKDNSEGRILDAIQKIQLGLVVEEQQAVPTRATFDFNVFAGDMIRTVDKRYSLEFYKKATNLIPLLPSLDPSAKFFLYSNRAGIHMTLKEFTEARDWYKKSLQAAIEDNPISIASAYNNLGVYFIEQQQYDSAEFFLVKCLDLLENKNMVLPLYCAANDNLAQIAIAHRQYDKALQTFQFNDSVYFRTKESFHKYVPNKLRMLTMMDRLNLPGIADSIGRVQSFINTYPLRIQPVDIRHFYRFAENYFFSNNLWESQAEYHNRFTSFVDSIELAKEDHVHALTKSLFSIQEARFKNEIKFHQLQAEQTKIKLRLSQRIFLIIILSVLSIAAVLTLYFRKRRQELQAQKQIAESALLNKEMEARLIRQDLELKKKDLTNVVLHNTHVYDHNLKMINKLHAIRGNEEQIKDQIRSLILEMNHQNMVGDRSLPMLNQIEAVNSEFFEKLKNNFPNLTKSEAELCGYIRINLSSKDISILKNIEASSVKMGKNRLRKKLGLEEQGDLYSFLQRI